MNPVVSAKFRMESNSELVFVLYAHNASFYRGEDFYIVRYALHIRSPDKFHGKCADSLESSLLIVKASELSAIGVAFYGHWQCADMVGILAGNFLGQKN